MADKHLDTALVNAGRSKKYTQGSVNSVIQRASSLVFDTVEEKARHAQPGQRRAVLRASRHADPFLAAGSDVRAGRRRRLRPLPCGAAAVANTILAFVEQGDHVLMTNTAYEPSQDFVPKFSPNSASPPAGSIR
jgi:cystathionine beta-lyase